MRLVPVSTSRSAGNIAAATVTVGTTRFTDLGAVIEGITGDDLAGTMILGVRAWGTLQATTAGVQDYTAALIVTASLVDAADVFPGTVYGGFPWWAWVNYKHRGTSHNVLAAASEFDVIQTRLHTRGRRKITRSGQTLWLAEETTGQNQSADWNYIIRYSR